ncbi:hypothetical protein LTR66_015467, partial [Elasticomyces elasticus]
LWKALYYYRYVRPRASRLPGIKESSIVSSLRFSSKLSKWLDDESLVKRGKGTNWKRQYKLRHNWTQGSCAISEIEVAEQPSFPPLLVFMHESVVFMADSSDGLRVWSSRGDRKELARIAFPGMKHGAAPNPPTSIAVDAGSAETDDLMVVVGFQDGSYSMYKFHHSEGRFTHRYSHVPSTNGILSAVAVSLPYLLTMTATQLLSLYSVSDDVESPPRLLYSLKSHTVWPPLSLSIRSSAQYITAAIAYALPTYLSGWTVGMQEMRLTMDGELIESRLASAIDQHFRPLTFSLNPSSLLPTPPQTPHPDSEESETRQIHSKPSTISYTHPYLLVSHPDNTLTLYLVSSTSTILSISSGSRLWGHTSSVSGAHIGGKGKAVSVSTRGNELRIWDLEGGFTSSASRRRLATGAMSVQIRPGTLNKFENDFETVTEVMSGRSTGLRLALEHGVDDLTATRGWIGFDEESVIVLKENGKGSQALVVYDFT